jgi:hypothetical protein
MTQVDTSHEAITYLVRSLAFVANQTCFSVEMCEQITDGARDMLIALEAERDQALSLANRATSLAEDAERAASVAANWWVGQLIQAWAERDAARRGVVPLQKNESHGRTGEWTRDQLCAYLAAARAEINNLNAERDILKERLKACIDPDQLTAMQGQRDAARAEVARLREALTNLLDRDERNTCQHEDTYRGGMIWEICSACGLKWEDGKGGKPEWVDPPEWVAARAALAEPTP